MIPAATSGIIGRDAELLYARSLLRRHDVRLVTLTGPGGVGKTTLASEIARVVAGEYPDGAYFIPLASITDPALVLPAIATSLGLRSDATPEALGEELGERDLLLVLDNFEQVDDAAPLITALLRAAPGIQVMITSRSLLRVSGEHQVQVVPLAAPALARLPALADLRTIPAVELFVTRAAAATGTFTLTPENAALVAQACSRLDGLPLAIELAAARLRHLPLAALVARLDHPLDVLVDGPRDAPARLRTLRDGLAWSYSLLSPTEQRLFRRLAVFAGGVTLELAGEVANFDDAFGDGILGGIASLVDSSLLVPIDHGVSPRYAMLETIREYAEEQLTASAEHGQLISRHLEAFLSLAEAANDALEGPDRSTWSQRIDAEQANLRVAIQRAITLNESERALRLTMALWIYWSSHKATAEGRRWLEQAVAMSAGAPTRLRVRAVSILGNLALSAFDLDDARQHYLEAMAIWQATGTADDVAASELGLGAVRRYQGEYEEALAHLERVRSVWAAADDRSGLAIAEHAIAALLAEAGKLPESQEGHARALQLRRAVGEPYGLAYTLVSAAIADRWAGEHVAALSAASEAQAAFESLRSSKGSVLATLVLALLAADGQRDTEALDLLRNAFTSHPGSLSVKASVEALELTAAILTRRGMARPAALLLSAATAHRRARGLVVPIPERMQVADTRAAIAEALGVTAFSAAWGEGQRLSLDQAIDSAVIAIEDPVWASSGGAVYDLTRRELEVLSLLAEHLSDREIADRLFLSPRTIERHVSNILLKMEAPNRRLAAAQAVRERLVVASP
jgi:predicted ATPase/DNA-binding NarL/FixJ family response regulator